MTGIRRALVLVGLTLAVMVGAAIPASATFADSVGVAGPTVTTITVPAPIQVEVKNVTCTSTADPATGTVTSTVSAMIEWQRMATPREGTGFRVTGHYSDGTAFEMAKTGATTFEVVGSWTIDLARSPRISVTTLTSYGWTAQSALISVPKC
jgi:hypothetical protein